MNLEVLCFILHHTPDLILEQGKEYNLKTPEKAVEAAHRVIQLNGDISNLSSEESLYFISCIQPLIVDVECNGAFGPDIEGNSTCLSGGIIEGARLLDCYKQWDFRCLNCHTKDEEMAVEHTERRKC